MSDAFIWSAPGRMGGEPCVNGTRVRVSDVLDYVDETGIEWVMRVYPNLTRPQILVACWYAAKNQQQYMAEFPQIFLNDLHDWALRNTVLLWEGKWMIIPAPHPRRNHEQSGSG